MNPILLMEEVDKVYIATSQMGFEALMAGKEVVCFGAPFYAGWGLTDDRQPIPHRKRMRTIEDIFYYSYIWYTHYHTPDSEGPCEIEDVIDYILENRNIEEPTVRPAADHAKVSIVIPVKLKTLEKNHKNDSNDLFVSF